MANIDIMIPYYILKIVDASNKHHHNPCIVSNTCTTQQDHSCIAKYVNYLKDIFPNSDDWWTGTDQDKLL